MKICFHINFILLILSAIFFNSIESAENHFDATGRMDRIVLGTGWLDLRACVKIPETGWVKTHSAESKKITYLEANGKKHWQSRIGDGELVDVEVTQTVSSTPDGMRFDFVASAFKDSDVEGVFFWIDVPAAIFANGTFETAGKNASFGTLPAERAEQKILSSGRVDDIQIFNSDKSIQLHAQLDAPANVTIQDGRQWSEHFSLLIQGVRGPMLKGQTAKFGIVMSATGQPDLSPALFTLDASKVRYAVQGLGGNYCFKIDAPEKAATLKELKPQFARTEISLGEWMPQKGGAPSAIAGKLPAEFETMRELSRLKIPFIASVWKAPAWMTRTIEHPSGRVETVIPSEHLPDAIDAIGSYLLYAKENFGSEPDYVSFNEPDYGAQIIFTPEEHRDAIKLLGAECEKRGLKTRCLLGDLSNPRTPIDYLKPALNDADAMKHVGAVSFHSWGGGSPKQYGAWSDLALSLKLPLIVAEAGVDPGAWKDKSFLTFEYAVREMAHYQDLFQYARPQAVLYWEYTSDYSLLEADPKNASARLETERFALQKHWLRFIPPGSEALVTNGENSAVQLTAFRKTGPRETGITLNLSNTQWPRKARISGIPPDVKSLNIIQTSRGVLFKTLAPIEPVNGVVEIDLPAQSLTTLTTRQ